MAKPVSPISTASSLFSIAPSSSHWNHKTVTVVLVLTGLSLLLYTIFTRCMSTSSTPTKKSLPPLPAHLIGKGSSHPFTSGLTHRNNPCINESNLPKFEEYASGIIRLDSTIFEDFEPGTPFNLRCKDLTGAIFFETCTITGKRNLDFFVSNLPFGRKITVEIGTDKMKLEDDMNYLKLIIEQPTGLYTLVVDKADSVALGDSKVLGPQFFSDLVALANPLALELDDDHYKLKLAEPSEQYLSITNLKERSVFHLLLISQNDALSVEERAVALPVVINAKQTATFSLQLLEKIWATQHKLATGQDKVSKLQLNLHLGGFQQIIYPEAKAE